MKLNTAILRRNLCERYVLFLRILVFRTFRMDCCKLTSAGIFKLLGNPGIDSKKSIQPVYVAWQAGETALFLLGF